MAGDICQCGHAFRAHEHYRRGTDCALCPRGTCTNYRAARDEPTRDESDVVKPRSVDDTPSQASASLDL